MGPQMQINPPILSRKYIAAFCSLFPNHSVIKNNKPSVFFLFVLTLFQLMQYSNLAYLEDHIPPLAVSLI